MTLREQAAKYSWYHSIEVGGGVRTSGQPFEHIWQFIHENLRPRAFKGMRVIDVGCRDGMFSLYAEAHGAARVTGVDNNISKGAQEFLLPQLQSKVQLLEANLYDMTPDQYGRHEVVMCFGVIYHLLFPVLGLHKLVQLTEPGGMILIETAIHVGGPDHVPLMFIPNAATQPYEVTCPSFFNRLGLITTMERLGCHFEAFDELKGSDRDPGNHMQTNVRRAFFEFRRNHEMDAALTGYWLGTHQSHSG